jgi:hypothetical protein
LIKIDYRIGRYGDFRRSMLASLPHAERQLLDALLTRDNDDFAIALVDSWAVVSELLTFYQERIANESYLRTATESLSVHELAQLIGYQPSPGVAASTFLAFTMESARLRPGAPPPTLRVDTGTQVKSVPGQDEQAQTFETVEPIDARSDWNALEPQTEVHQVLEYGDKELYLEGIATQLEVGDPILIVGAERDRDERNNNWDFRFLKTVEADADLNLTRVTWEPGLGGGGVHPAREDVRVYAMRERAALFGHNAPQPQLLSTENTGGLITNGEWDGFVIDRANNTVDLDKVYPRIVDDSWIVLENTEPQKYFGQWFGGYTELYRPEPEINGAISRADFGLSAKVTRVIVRDNVNMSKFELRNTVAHVVSEHLPMAKRRLDDPAYGTGLRLAATETGLEPGRALAVFGSRMRVRKAPRSPALTIVADDGTTMSLALGDTVQVLEAPICATGARAMIPPDQLLKKLGPHPAGSTQLIEWLVRADDGFTGRLVARGKDVMRAAINKDDEPISEIVHVAPLADAVTSTPQFTELRFAAALKNVYERSTVLVNANVAAATHGETVEELLGSGDSTAMHQRFRLRQTPLTYVSSADAGGRRSTLEIRVNDILWTEVATLHGQESDDQIYVTRTDADGVTTVTFGDGKAGARLPTGESNVRARYRKGIGVGGLVKGGQLSQLMTRPLGLKDAINPEPASGAEDAESRAQTRDNAPLTMLTLDRAVSLQDYEDFASAFAGISKATATWTWDGRHRGVFLTVAGVDGATVEPGREPYDSLIAAIAAAGEPYVRVNVRSYRDARFHLAARVRVNPAYEKDAVLAAVEDHLRDAFSFRLRSFGQRVALSEVYAVLQSVDGVDAVDVNQLYRSDESAGLNERLPAHRPVATSPTDIESAELLTLDPAPLLDLGEMA